MLGKQVYNFKKTQKTDGSRGVKVELDDKFNHPERGSVDNLSHFHAVLPDLVGAVCSALGPKNLEATYQRCLAIELLQMGVHVEQEVELYLTYKGHVVGTRRADMILTLASGEKCILELKALASHCSRDNVNQLKYYMHHFRIGHGFLINFPHECGFPEVEQMFEELSIQGPRPPNKSRAKAVDMEKMIDNIQIIHIREGDDGNDILADYHEDSDNEEVVFGVTKAGTSCKRCLKLNDFCNQHESQRKVT